MSSVVHWWLAGVLALVSMQVAQAQRVVIRAEQDPVLARYEARTIVTGTDLRDRPKGLAACLTDVLVKVSGDPTLAGDPAVAALTADAGRYVAEFDYWDRMTAYEHHDDQGSYDRPFNLTARFDPARIDAALRQLGRTPWPDPRPTLVPIVHVQGRAGAFELTRDEPRADDMRATLFDAEQRYGITISIPTAAERGAWRAGGFTASSDRVALSGSLVFSPAAQGWVATWHLDRAGQGFDWSVDGVNFDEAFRLAVRGAVQVLSGHGAPSG